FRDHCSESITVNRLRRVLAGASATEIGTGQQDRSSLETRIVQRMLFVAAVLILANVVKEILSEAVESNALHKPSRNDPVGIDIVARNVNSAPCYFFNGFKSHD